MEKKLTQDEIVVRKELEKIYPQLKINAQKTCGYNTPLWADDLLSISIMFFLEKPVEKQLQIISDGKIEHYITFIMGTQVRSGSSRFFTQHRKFSTAQREIYDNNTYKDRMVTFPTPFEDEEDELTRCIKYHMEQLNPYEKMIITEKILEGKTFKDISRNYDIPYTSLTRTAEETLKKLKELCKHLY